MKLGMRLVMRPGMVAAASAFAEGYEAMLETAVAAALEEVSPPSVPVPIGLDTVAVPVKETQEAQNANHQPTKIKKHTIRFPH